MALYVGGTILSGGGGGGIDQADMWGLSSDITTSTSQTTITSGFQRFGLTGLGRIGTGMTQSSGIFTFPETGIYQVKFHAMMKADSSANRYIAIKIMVDPDGDDSYTTGAQAFSSLPNLGYTFSTVEATTICDVTNTTNYKVSFLAYSAASAVIDSGVTYPTTHFSFMRLGDT